MLTQDQVKANIEALEKQGASQGDIQGYLDSLRGKVAPNTPVAKEKGFFRGAFDLFTGNTQAFGKSAGEAFAANSKPADELRESNVGLSNQIAQTEAVIRQKKMRGEDTTQLEQTLARAKGVSSATQPNQVFDVLNKSNSQVAGEALGTGLEILSGGALGAPAKATAPVLSRTLRTVAQSVPFGYGFDVSQNLQEGETGAEAFKPGLGTAFSIAIPGALGIAQKGKELIGKSAPSIINSLIKPLAKEYRFGKNPGRVIAEEGIRANTWEELAETVGTRKNQVGAQISSLDPGVTVSMGDELAGKAGILKPLDEALTQAAKQNNQALYNRIKETLKALTQRMVRTSQMTPDEVIAAGLVSPEATMLMNTPEGRRVVLKEAQQIIKSDSIISLGERNMDNMSWADALELKRLIGDVTSWTSNRTDDNIVNKALRQVYHGAKERMNSAVRAVDPKQAKIIEKLNEKYADLISADNAVRYREMLTQNKNVISAPIKAGTAAGLITAFATGGVSVAAALVGIGVAGLDKALGSVAVKTRLAAWIAKAEPGVLQKVFTQNPAIRNVILKAISGSDNEIEQKAEERLKNLGNEEKDKSVDDYVKSLGL